MPTSDKISWTFTIMLHQWYTNKSIGHLILQNYPKLNFCFVLDFGFKACQDIFTHFEPGGGKGKISEANHLAIHKQIQAFSQSWNLRAFLQSYSLWLSHSHRVSGLSHSHIVSGFTHSHVVSGLSHSHIVSRLSHSHIVSGFLTVI